MLGGTAGVVLKAWLDFGESYLAIVFWKSSKLIGGRKSKAGGVGEFAFSVSPKLKRLSLLPAVLSSTGSLVLLGRKVRRACKEAAALLSLTILLCFSANSFIFGHTSNLLPLLGDSNGRGPNSGALFSFSVDLRR